MPRAYCLIRDQPHYRSDAFRSGLARAGFAVETTAPGRNDPGDVLVCWNRYSSNHEIATRFEERGGVVMVAENGYVRGPHDGGGYYALALDAHNGRGRWPVGGPERWDALGIDLKPWRETGAHVLVACNRTFGQPGSAMPPEWPAQVKKRLQAVTKREIRVRMHPGNERARVPLEDDLRNAWAVVVWSSSVGVRALIEGVPVISEARWWIAELAGLQQSVQSVESLYASGAREWARVHALRRLAWAQWHVDELATGEPFVRLLEHHHEARAVPA